MANLIIFRRKRLPKLRAQTLHLICVYLPVFNLGKFSSDIKFTISFFMCTILIREFH